MNLTAIWLGIDKIPLFKTMRTLRGLRPLRALSRLQSMKVIFFLLFLKVSLINFAASLLGAGGFQAFKTMRTLRALRPLRAMSRMQGMRVTTKTACQKSQNFPTSNTFHFLTSYFFCFYIEKKSATTVKKYHQSLIEHQLRCASSADILQSI